MELFRSADRPGVVSPKIAEPRALIYRGYGIEHRQYYKMHQPLHGLASGGA